MQKGILFILALIFLPPSAEAQQTPSAEIYLGFPLLQRENASQLFGAHAALTLNPRPWFGVKGDVGMHFGEVFADKSLGTVLGGPVFSAGSGTRLRAFGHTLFATAISGCGTFNNGCRTDAVFSAAFGGGIDIRPGSRVRFRVEAGELLTRFGRRDQHFLRLSFGVVIPLGF